MVNQFVPSEPLDGVHTGARIKGTAAAVVAESIGRGGWGTQTDTRVLGKLRSYLIRGRSGEKLNQSAAQKRFLRHYLLPIRISRCFASSRKGGVNRTSYSVASTTRSEHGTAVPSRVAETVGFPELRTPRNSNSNGRSKANPNF